MIFLTGVDPIQEAIVEYNRARQGNALPPDIYLGLRFGDADEKPTSDMTPKGKVSIWYSHENKWNHCIPFLILFLHSELNKNG